MKALSFATALAVILAAPLARADLVDVNFYSGSYGGAPAQNGAVVGGTGDHWNGYDGDLGAGGPFSLLDAGNSATTVTASYNTNGGAAITAANNTYTTPNQTLMLPYLYNNQGGAIDVNLAGLLPDTSYELYVYVASNDAAGGNRAAQISANGASALASGDPATSFVSGSNYVLLNPISDATGAISIVESDDSATNISGEVDFNGLQLEGPLTASTPDGAATGGLLGCALIGLWIVSRASKRTS